MAQLMEAAAHTGPLALRSDSPGCSAPVLASAANFSSRCAAPGRTFAVCARSSKLERSPAPLCQLSLVQHSQGGRVHPSARTRASAWGPLAPLVELLGKKGPGSEEQRAQLKEELLELIAPLQRGVAVSDSDKEDVDELASKLEALNPTPAPLRSPLLNGKWKLVYTTSGSILGTNNPVPFLRPFGPIFQCIDTETLQARNIQSWPFFNQVQASLTPVSKSRVDVVFDEFKILSLIAVKAPRRDGQAAYLDTTYLDGDLRISRGNLGNLFILVMDDSSYRIEKPE